VPAALWEQLEDGGRIVLPLKTGRRAQSLCVLRRTAQGPRLLATLPARYVPLISDDDEA
jgi:protein-L-isoaspartate O-methyltransferase